MVELAGYIARALRSVDDEKELEAIRESVLQLTSRFPLYDA